MAIEMRVVGLDVAKNVFQIHGVDGRGATVLRKPLRRSQFIAKFSGSAFWTQQGDGGDENHRRVPEPYGSRLRAC
jgi:hypothetical protein